MTIKSARSVGTLLPVVLLAAALFPQGVAAQEADRDIWVNFDEAAWEYSLTLFVPRTEGDLSVPRLLVSGSVAPGERADSVRVMWFMDEPLGSSGPASVRVHVDERDLLVPVTFRRSDERTSTIVFDLSVAQVAGLARAGSVILKSAGQQIEFSPRATLGLRRFHSAATHPDSLAVLAHGAGSRAADLRQPRDPRQDLAELAAFRITYDRFADRHTVAVAAQRADVLRGADSARARVLYFVEGGTRSETMGIGLVVYGADTLDGTGWLRAELGAMDTVIEMPRGQVQRPAANAQVVVFGLPFTDGMFAFLGNLVEFRLKGGRGAGVELSLPADVRRVFGQASDIARTREQVEAWARDVYGCPSLIEMSRAGTACELTIERFKEMADRRRSGAGR